jgi:hypothetical protein
MAQSLKPFLQAVYATREIAHADFQREQPADFHFRHARA